PTRAKDAATSMKITAQDLLDLKIIDGIIAEPLGGAHRGADTVIAATGEQIARTLADFAGTNMDFREQRREKYLAMGRRREPLGVRGRFSATNMATLGDWRVPRGERGRSLR